MLTTFVTGFEHQKKRTKKLRTAYYVRPQYTNVYTLFPSILSYYQSNIADKQQLQQVLSEHVINHQYMQSENHCHRIQQFDISEII